MADALSRVTGPTSLTATAATVYTVPTATVTTMTTIHVANEGTTTATFTMSIGTDAAGRRFFYRVPIYAGDSFNWTGQLVLTATEVVQAYASTASVLTLVISGVVTT